MLLPSLGWREPIVFWPFGVVVPVFAFFVVDLALMSSSPCILTSRTQLVYLWDPIFIPVYQNFEIIFNTSSSASMMDWLTSRSLNVMSQCSFPGSN